MQTDSRAISAVGITEVTWGTLSSLVWPWQLLTSYLLSYLSDWTRWQIYTRPHAQMLHSVKWDRFWPLIGRGLWVLWLHICYLYCIVVDRNSVNYCSSMCSQNRKNVAAVKWHRKNFYSTRQSLFKKKEIALTLQKKRGFAPSNKTNNSCYSAVMQRPNVTKQKKDLGSVWK